MRPLLAALVHGAFCAGAVAPALAQDDPCPDAKHHPYGASVVACAAPDFGLHAAVEPVLPDSVVAAYLARPAESVAR